MELQRKYFLKLKVIVNENDVTTRYLNFESVIDWKDCRKYRVIHLNTSEGSLKVKNSSADILNQIEGVNEEI